MAKIRFERFAAKRKLLAVSYKLLADAETLNGF